MKTLHLSTSLDYPETIAGAHQQTNTDHGPVKDRETVAASQTRTHSRVLEFAGSILSVVIALVVFKATGLYDAADSIVVKVGLGSLMGISYLALFRHALYAKPQRAVCCGRLRYRQEEEYCDREKSQK